MSAAIVGGGGWFLTTRSSAAIQPYTETGPGDVYVALGDSLAAGFIVSDRQAAYVAQITQALQHQNDAIAVRNFAVPGETSTSMLRRQLPQALQFIKAQRAAGKRVSPITLDIGGNDGTAVAGASNETRRRTLASIEANIDTALVQLVEATTENGQRTADIAIMTYYNPFLGDVSDETTNAYWGDQLNQAIVRAAERHGVVVADVATPFAGGNVYRYTYLANGDVHANDAGHGVIAEQFMKALGYE